MWHKYVYWPHVWRDVAKETSQINHWNVQKETDSHQAVETPREGQRDRVGDKEEEKLPVEQENMQWRSRKAVFSESYFLFLGWIRFPGFQGYDC